MAQVYVFEVADEDDECVTRIRVLADNMLEVEMITPFEASRMVLTPKEAREFARDLNAAAKVCVK